MNQQVKTIVFVNTGIPNTYTGGGALTAYCLTDEMKKAGLKVVGIVIVEQKTADYLNAEFEKYKNLVDELHVIFTNDHTANNHGLFKKIINKFSGKLETVYPEVKYADQVREIVNQVKPDAVMAYHFQALAAITEITGVPKIGLVGDPQFAVVKSRFGYFLKRGSWRHILLAPFFPWLYFKYKKFDAQLLNQCQIRGAFAAQHVKELERAGVSGIKYYHTPIFDPLAGDNKKINTEVNNQKLKILLLGHLKGIVTITGLSLFVKETLPILLKEIGKDNFEINIVGGYFETLPKYIKNGLLKANINIKGYQKDISSEMLANDVFLVPTPIKLGVRVRIITAIGWGGLVVSHVANHEGIPELRDGFNCLLASSAQELADKIVDCYNKKYDLEDIRNNGRLTFDKYFRSDVAVGVIMKDVLSLFEKFYI